jgi:hypothetical protein
MRGRWSSLPCTLVRLSALALLAFTLSACQEDTSPSRPAPTGAALTPVPALRFAGASALLVLRRVAAEANLLLVVDEFKDAESNPDLLYVDVDVDLPAGPVYEALMKLEELTEAFGFAIHENVIYVRSRRLTESSTQLDANFLKAHEFSGALPKLTRYLMKRAPRTLLRSLPSEGQPYHQKVTLQIERGDSVIDVLLRYSIAANRGLWIQRAGHLVEEEEEGTSFMASTVQLWSNPGVVTYVPTLRQTQSVVTALADAQRITKTPIAVFDRAVIPDLRGALDYQVKVYREAYTFEENMRALGHNARGPNPDFDWAMQDGVAVVRSGHHQLWVSGLDLLEEKVAGGGFEGTLPELVRWINQQRVAPTPRRLMGGEITGSGRRGALEVAEGTTLRQVLIDFARASGEGFNYVIVESAQVEAEDVSDPRRSRGAFITRLSDWVGQEELKVDTAREAADSS